MLDLPLQLFPELSSARLHLRQLQPGDANKIFLLRSDDRVNAFIDRPKATSVDEAAAFINKIGVIVVNGEGLMWAITIKDDPMLIGTIGVFNIIKEKSEAEIGYEMLPRFQGQGLMLEGLRSAIAFAFGTLKLKTIVANSRVENLPSIIFLEKCGFMKTEVRDGQYLMYQLTDASSA